MAGAGETAHSALVLAGRAPAGTTYSLGSSWEHYNILDQRQFQQRRVRHSVLLGFYRMIKTYKPRWIFTGSAIKMIPNKKKNK
jgi:hypothetical protein